MLMFQLLVFWNKYQQLAWIYIGMYWLNVIKQMFKFNCLVLLSLCLRVEDVRGLDWFRFDVEIRKTSRYASLMTISYFSLIRRNRQWPTQIRRWSIWCAYDVTSENSLFYQPIAACIRGGWGGDIWTRKHLIDLRFREYTNSASGINEMPSIRDDSMC